MSSTNSGGGDAPWPWGSSVPLSGLPSVVKDLIGKKCRIVNKGDAVTMDYVAGRVTLFLDANSRIADITFEPERDSVNVSGQTSKSGHEVGNG